MKYLRILVLILLLTLMTGCSFGRSIDTSSDLVTLYEDGEYKVSSLYYNSYGYKENLVINILDGIINEISYSEVNKNGQLRSSILPTQRWAGCKYSYNQIIQNLYENTLLRQNNSIDSITGATLTVDHYHTLLNTALENAENGKPADETINQFSDVYSVINEIDPTTGIQERLTITYKNGIISDVSVIDVLNGSSFSSDRLFAQLASITKKNGTLEEVVLNGVDQNILYRYNHLLSEIRKIREN